MWTCDRESVANRSLVDSAIELQRTRSNAAPIRVSEHRIGRVIVSDREARVRATMWRLGDRHSSTPHAAA